MDKEGFLKVVPFEAVKGRKKIHYVLYRRRYVAHTGEELNTVAGRKKGGLFYLRHIHQLPNTLFEFRPRKGELFPDFDGCGLMVQSYDYDFHWKECRLLNKILTPKKVKSITIKPITDSSAVFFPLQPAVKRMCRMRA